MMAALLGGMAVGLGLFLVRPTASGHRWVTSRPKDGAARRPPKRDVRETVEAVANWTDQLRDTISASGGLQQAISATESLAPLPIRPEVRRLVSDLTYGDLESGLRRFAESIGHPSCDFVVAALITAHRHHARDLSELLGHLADCAREECRMHLRVWVARARLRSAMRIVKVVIIAFVAGLVALDPGYLRPFATADGSVVLLGIVVDLACAVWLMNRLGQGRQGFRFVGRRAETAQ